MKGGVGWGGGATKGEDERGVPSTPPTPCRRGRDSLLMSIWWVFYWSRDSFVLLLFPESSISLSEILRAAAQRTGCGFSVRLVTASCQRELIGSSQFDPGSFPYFDTDQLFSSEPTETCIQMPCLYITVK